MQTLGGRVAIIGSGPAALMAADVVSAAGVSVEIFEKRKSAGRKLLVAGSSGLNVSNNLELEDFASHYTGPGELWKRLLSSFPPEAWIRFINELGISTFLGTSGRYFVEDMKASRFLQAWTQRLRDRGVKFHFDHECVGFTSGGSEVSILFSGDLSQSFDVSCFALGGGSWEGGETPLRWPALFKSRGLGFEDFAPSNVGYQIAWPEAFLKEAEGKPLKSVVLSSPRGHRKGDAMVTRYGIEGTPVYFVGRTGEVRIDLKPDLGVEQIVDRLSKVKENLSPIRRVGKLLGLCEASFALLFHLTPESILKDRSLTPLARWLKSLPLNLGDPQPLAEAISSSGGLRLDELNESLMLKKHPGVFAAGEMLDWDAPTGGFLIQACVSQGVCAGRGILKYLGSK